MMRAAICRALFSAVGKMTALACGVVFNASAQSQAIQKPAFEVVSVKPDKSSAISSRLSMDGGRFLATYATATELAQWAYRVPPGRMPYLPTRIIGAPKWTDTDRFRVEATVNTDRPIAEEEMLPMVQS